jgi:UDP:flavonoid glycosyltransferase YjiC (YdhE family)
LLVAHDAGGTIPPLVALVQAIVAAGHEAIVLSQPSVRDRARASGAEFVAFDGLGDYEPGVAIEEQLELAFSLIAGVGVREQVQDLVRDRSADVVVVDCNLASALAAAEALAQPSAVLFHSMFATFTDVWFADLWPLLAESVNDARGAYGLPAAASWVETFAGHERLVPVVPASFDAPSAAFPEPLRHYGFFVPPSAGASVALPPSPGGEPTVLVSLSTTYQEQEDLLARIVGALAARPARAFVTTGGQVDASTLAAPGHVEVHDWLDHAEVLPATDVVVTHGGLGTCAGALSHGVPLVCIPLGRDQHLNGERVAAVGAGIALAADSTAAEIGAAIDRVLADRSYRAAATRIAAESTAAGGPAAAVADLEALVDP